MAWLAAIIGRLCLSVLFIVAGIGKLTDPAGTAQYITSVTNLPGSLAVPTGILEIAGGVLLALGFMTRLVSIALAAFVALATVLFHGQVTDPAQAQTALKNLAVFGGLLMVFAYGQVSWRMDSWKERDKRHDAEVALARAEARGDALQHNAGTAVPERRGFFDRMRGTHHRTVTDRDMHGRDVNGRTVADRTDGDPRT